MNQNPIKNVMDSFSTVFVIGGNHHNALGVIRSLGEKGVNPYVIIQTDEKQPYISKSKYIQKYRTVRTDDEVLQLLRKEGERLSFKAVLITCSDGLSSLVDLNYYELSKWYLLPGSIEQGQITKLMDKEVMSELAVKVGYLVPESIAVGTKELTTVNIPRPWIIKPLVSKDGKKTDIKRIYTSEDWLHYCEQHDAKVQVQHLIDKDFEYQLIGLSLNGGKEVIVPGYSYVIRPAATTNTGFLQYRPLNKSFKDVVEKGRLFLKATGYSGLFSLEFLRGKDGKDYFMEINFRNDGNAICVTAAGVNLPYIWYLYNTGANYKSEISNTCTKPVYVMPEFADISLVIHRKLGLFSWLEDVRRSDRFMEYDKYDKAPFYLLLKQFVKREIKKIEHRVI